MTATLSTRRSERIPPDVHLSVRRSQPMPRPLWSGHIHISLVSFSVKLFPLVEAKSEIHFHQLNRKTGERIRHQKVAGDQEPVGNEDIVKGYEYRKGKYL